MKKTIALLTLAAALAAPMAAQAHRAWLAPTAATPAHSASATPITQPRPPPEICCAIGLALPHIRSGKLRVLAVASEKRSSVLPNTPAMSEVLPGFLSVIWLGVVAPAGTPPAIANQFSIAIAEMLKQPDVSNRLLELNFEPVGSTPAAMSTFMEQERVRWRKVIRDSGATADQ